MIPMADALNHSDVSVLCEVVTKSLHMEADEKSTYFTRTKFMNNYEHLFTPEEITQHGANITGRFNKSNFEANKMLASTQFYLSQSYDHQIWEIPYVKDTFDEDNDTSDEESSDEDEEDEGKDPEYAKMMDLLKGLMAENASKKTLKELEKGGALRFFIA